MNKSISLKNILMIIAIFLSPFNTLVFPGLYLTISDIFFIILFPFVVLNLSYRNNDKHLAKNKKRNSRYIVKRWLIGCWFLVIGFLISALFSTEVLFNSTLSIILQYVFVFVYLPILLLTFDGDYSILIKSYIYGIFSVVMIGLLIEYFFGGLYINLIYKGIFVGRNRFGSFLGSNGLVKVIAMCMPMLFSLLNKKKLSKVNMFFIMFVFSIGIVKASSIGGTLAVIFSTVLSLMFIRDREIRKTFIILGMVLT